MTKSVFWLPCSCLYKKIKNIHKLQKILKKISVVDNVVSHNYEKYQVQICCILGYTKMTNLIKFRDRKCIYSDLYFCLFCVVQNTMYFNLIFCMVVGYTNIYTRDFFQHFLKLEFFLIFFKQAGSPEVGSTKSSLLKLGIFFLLMVYSHKIWQFRTEQ